MTILRQGTLHKLPVQRQSRVRQCLFYNCNIPYSSILKEPFLPCTQQELYQKHLVKHVLCYKIWSLMDICESIPNICY